jgi:hypothetical protein
VLQDEQTVAHCYKVNSRTKGRYLFAFCSLDTPVMPSRKLTPVQVLERLPTRLEKRMEVLQRVKLDSFQMVIAELEAEQDYLRRAKRYLEG